MKIRLFMIGVVAAAFAACAETIFIEAEAFKDYGGWVNDTQFMDQMGSPFLLAHGMGNPVKDATTTFDAQGGNYNVWVRTRNWTYHWHPGVGAGTFNLVVNGVMLPNLLGAQGKGEWLWVKAEDVTLKAGENSLAIHDCDGFDGRVDAVCFTTEADPWPILNGPRHPSVAIEPSAPKEYDLCVVGGGIAGICAAVSASRLGLSVALVHDRPILGGNNSSEVRVNLGAYQNILPYPRLGDVLAEFGPKSGGNAREASTYEDDLKMQVVKAEKNIDLLLNEHVNGVETNVDGRIVSVRAVNTRTGVATLIKAANFADCTGDGTVGFLAGADFRMGREAKSETNEPDAPEKADTLTMGASVQWYAGKAKGSVAFPMRPWMLKSFNDKNCSPHLKGDWWWEVGLGRDQIAEAEYIRDYGLLVAFSNWAYVKNFYKKKGRFADKEFKWVAYNAGRRESRRLLGDFILDQNHLQNRDHRADGTCVATWTIDLHLPKSEEQTKFKGEPFQTNSLNEKIWPYPIPYRCFYSRNVPNLFMAGRDISVTHIALGTTRLMRTHGMMGEVVGMAAAVCKKHDCSPRDIYKMHLDELRCLMMRGVGDGARHPRQDYNCQQSLDQTIKDKYETDFNRPTIKVRAIGNSFSLSCIRQLPQVAKANGHMLDFASLYIGGCSLERHCRNIEAAATNATFRPYRFDRVTEGRHVVSKGSANIQDALRLDKWHVVTIQQTSSQSWNAESYSPWGDRLVDKIRELAPQAKILVQETWSYPTWDKRLATFGFDQAEMYKRLHNAYRQFANQHGLWIIPTGTAAELVPNRNSLFTEPDFHFNKGEGEYLQALVWDATLFGRDPGLCPYRPAGVLEERAKEFSTAVSKALRIASSRSW